MDTEPDDARIYLLDETDRKVTGDGPAVVDAHGTRHEVPPMVFEAIEHVIGAFQSGYAVKVIPLRTELPIGEAADAIEIGEDDLRRSIADGEIPFRSSRYVDWVRLADVMDFAQKRQAMREEGLQALLDQERWDESDGDDR
ncbi:MAG: hypothetical protein ACRDP9_22320 [Kribbellaceae bacterium]